MSALPEGVIRLSAAICSTWELFLASEDWCAERANATDDSWRAPGSPFKKRAIENYIIHPVTRASTGRKPRAKKILISGYPSWSHGRVYYDLCRQLHDRGYVADIIDWQKNNKKHVDDIIGYYDVIMTAPDGVTALVDAYRIPHERIVVVAHHEQDLRTLVERKGLSV